MRCLHILLHQLPHQKNIHLYLWVVHLRQWTKTRYQICASAFNTETNTLDYRKETKTGMPLSVFQHHGTLGNMPLSWNPYTITRNILITFNVCDTMFQHVESGEDVQSINRVQKRPQACQTMFQATKKKAEKSSTYMLPREGNKLAMHSCKNKNTQTVVLHRHVQLYYMMPSE